MNILFIVIGVLPIVFGIIVIISALRNRNDFKNIR